MQDQENKEMSNEQDVQAPGADINDGATAGAAQAGAFGDCLGHLFDVSVGRIIENQYLRHVRFLQDVELGSVWRGRLAVASESV